MTLEVGDPFTCDLCAETFLVQREAIDVDEEYRRNFPIEYALGAEEDVLCQPCYEEFMTWWRKEIIRERKAR